MSYEPSTPVANTRLGYVRAGANTVTSFDQAVFDNPVPTGPYVSSGNTVLPGTSLCIMRVNRADDFTTEMRSWFTMGSSSPDRAGCIDVITTKLFHGVNESYDYRSTIIPTQIFAENPANIIIDSWSHFFYWRA